MIRMRRRAPTEHVEPYRRRVHAAEGNAIRDRLAAWAGCRIERLEAAWPEMPPGIEDRNADVWEALLAIADAAGGEWPTTARVAAFALVALAMAGTPSLGVRLLADLRQIYGDRDAISTEDILRELIALEESPWTDLRGKPIDARRLARYLHPYGVTSKVVRIGTSTPRGYTKEDLHDPWIRYLGEAAKECATCATSATSPASETTETPVCPRCDGEGCGWCANRVPNITESE